ncbi:hypothetical protein JKF63_02123 [Porcisia hertigi]|uniref:CW-type domain-containing protein n=1 Tax=Porcisia hertigi TaxID=2761500 RepID=A0A836IGT6_9TRYP|nr:hypothetical protein JKF63_02123 [Porcisia hertigi]
MKSESPGADKSLTASLPVVPTPAAPGAAAGTSRLSVTQEIRTEPRYIRLPDALYALRYRYPSVTESVFLECTRCHQWVAVPALREIPNEIASAAVSSSALGLDSISERTSSYGPLRHTYQDHLRRREELANDAAAPQWRSRRLQEKQSHLASRDIDHNGGAHDNVDDEAPAASQRGFFESILQQLRRKRRPLRGDAEDSATLISESTHQKHAPLYIPNPDTFICAGWQCAWGADALADLRRDWMQKIYGALPMPSVGEDSLTLSSDVSSSSFPHSPVATFAEALQQRKAALNEALAQELDIGRSRRGGRVVVQRTGHTEHDSGDQDSLPTLSLPSSAAECDTELSRMQGSWVRAAALHLLRSSGVNGSGSRHYTAKSMTEDDEAEFSRRRPYGVEEDSHGNVLSAYCWAVCDACGKLRRVAQPFPGGAPFVCAMAVTSSSSCRAHRSGSASHPGSSPGLDHACCVSEMEGLMQCNMKLCEAELIYAALSSPFLPYPLRAQVASLSRQQTCAKEPAEQLSRADMARALLSEPLLRTIRASVRESVARGTPTRNDNQRCHTSTTEKPCRKTSVLESNDPDAELTEEHFLYRSLPILRELARTIKARSRSTFVRQVQLTPAQIRAKREAVMRDSFLIGHQHATTTVGGSGTEERKDAALIPSTTKAETAGMVVKVEEKNTANTEHAESLSPRPTRARRAAPPSKTTKLLTEEEAPPSMSLSAPAPVGKEKEPTSVISGSGTSSHPPLAKSTPALSRRHATREAATEAAQQVQPPPGPIAPRKRGRPPRQQPDEQHKLEASVKHVTTEATVVAADVKTTPPRRRRQRCENVPEEGQQAAESSVAAAKEAEAVEDVANFRASSQRRQSPGSRPTKRGYKQGARVGGRKAKAANEEEWEVVHWVQCDLCKKWRIVPERVPAHVKFWECKMRYHEEHQRATTCDDPDDAELSP